MKKWLCGLLICVLLTGCAGAEAPMQESVFAMDTLMELKLWGAEAEAAAKEVKGLLARLEADWSVSEADSLICQLNRGQGSPDAGQQALLEEALALQTLTGGAFDPKMLAHMELWGFRSGNYRVPDGKALAQVEKKWDLGGILKGYAGEQAVKILEQHRVDRAILNLGGNVQTYGQKPDGSPWIIAIQDPKGGSLGNVSVVGTMAVVTSGDYQRFFELDGRRYHHILDPKTGRPAESGLCSVTVICPSGTRADALSTALFVMGLEEGSRFWRENGDFEAVFVTAQGKIYATEGAAFSGSSWEVISR